MKNEWALIYPKWHVFIIPYLQCSLIEIKSILIDRVEEKCCEWNGKCEMIWTNAWNASVHCAMASSNTFKPFTFYWTCQRGYSITLFWYSNRWFKFISAILTRFSVRIINWMACVKSTNKHSSDTPQMKRNIHIHPSKYML